MNIYLVGGAVRDRLLGWPVSEQDWLVTGATPEQMLALGYQPVGRDFPVFLHPETKEEYALARTERKVAQGYQGFSFFTSPSVTVEDDLRRRDLTINAMARQPGGPLIDPYGGLQDLKARRLRHVSDAFIEDPLRVLRVARFAARYHHLGFFVAPETLALMRAISDSGELAALSAERIWKEISRGLMERSPQTFFEVLLNCGALQKLLPEVAALVGVPQPAKHHPEIDTFKHLMLCLQQSVRAGLTLAERYAILCHDLGKGTTAPQHWPQHIAHEKRGIALADAVSKRLKVPTPLADLARKVAEFHTHCHRALELRPDTLHQLFTKLDGSRKPETVESFIRCCECDARGRATLEDRDYPQADYLRQAYTAWQNVEVGELVAQGFQGAELGRAIAQQRISQLEAFRKQCQHLSP